MVSHFQGPCTFDVITDHHGNTSADFTPNNDVVIPYTTDDACKERCFQETSLIASANDVTEECWGFTTTATECILHVVVRPDFFDDGKHYASAGDTFYIKRCFFSRYP